VVYEFVVAGTLGPITRSMLDGLEIVDLGVETWLRLTRAGDEELLSLLSSVITGDRELERVLVDDYQLSASSSGGR